MQPTKDNLKETSGIGKENFNLVQSKNEKY